MSTRIAVLVLSLSVSPILGHAQKSRITFEHLTVDHGLSENSVTCILQDSRGYMWFGTEGGLNRYDGYRLMTYHRDPSGKSSISSNSISAILEPKSLSGQVLWIGVGTWVGSGMNKLDLSSDSFTYYPDAVVEDVHEDSTGTLWIATQNGLRYFDPQNGTFEREMKNVPGMPGFSKERINSISQDLTGTYWLGTNHGLVRHDAQTGEYFLHKHADADTTTIADDTVYTVFVDRGGILWLGTANGLDRLDAQHKTITHYKHDQHDPHSLSSNAVRAILEDRNGLLWIGTLGGGVCLFDDRTNRFETFIHDPADERSLNDNRIESLYEDRSGSIWIGTAHSGVDKAVVGDVGFSLYMPKPNTQSTLHSRPVWSFFEPGQVEARSLWLGTQKGISVFDRENGTFSRLLPNHSLSTYPIRAMCKDSVDGSVWIGTLHGGLFNVNARTGNVKNYEREFNSVAKNNNLIYALAFEGTHRLWIGTNGEGLWKYDREKRDFARQVFRLQYMEEEKDLDWALALHVSRDVKSGRDGTLWIATFSAGLIKLDLETLQYTQYLHDSKNPASLGSNSTLSICEPEAEKGVLWIGTDGSGLNRFDLRTKSFTRFTTEDGLPDNVVNGIVEDRFGVLWISTNAGLSRFDPRTRVFKNYTVHDGLQGNEFTVNAAYRSSSGELYFGGINGFNRFMPVNNINAVPPLVAFTGFKRFGNEASPALMTQYQKNGMEVAYGEGFFTFNFVALHFKQPRDNRYAFKLDGYDVDWHYGKDREANYGNVPPGSYTFMVKAANSDGVWNETGTSVTISVALPFWRTWWFYGGVALVVVIAAFLFRRSGIRQVLSVERARSEEGERLRKKLAADFHDEIGHKITAISLSTKLLERELSLAPATVRDHVNKIGERADQMFKEIHELTWELDPTKDSLQDLAEHLKGFSDQLFETTSIAFRIVGLPSESETIKLPLEWRQHLTRILKEAMNNIARHAPGCRNVTLAFGLAKRELNIELANDGPGFDTVPSSGGNGLTNMRERAKLIHGELIISSSSTSGTTVRFRGKLP